MQIVQPKVILLGETQLNPTGLDELLETVGSNAWRPDAEADADILTEVAGRLCYKSFEVGLNANVTKIREGNRDYIKNLLGQRHGSVMEHASATIAFLNVSRVFTHELVRHRIAGFSQESLRYVRLTELSAYYPDAFKLEHMHEIAAHLVDNGKLNQRDAYNWAAERADFLNDKFHEVFGFLERTQKEISAILQLDDITKFDVKKKVTSAMRRLAPLGLCTNVIMTANHRTWRWVIEQRSSAGAEEEIQKVFTLLGGMFMSRYPGIYQDARVSPLGIDHIAFSASKV